jgi:DTW domain-containing protein YfiP
MMETEISSIAQNLAAASLFCITALYYTDHYKRHMGLNADSSSSPPPPPPHITVQKKRREVCTRCHRPKPRACICHALPDEPLVLKDTAVVILQHPHEFKHKNNRSVPLLDLCFSPSNDNKKNDNNLHPSPLYLCVGRRLGDQIPLVIQELLQPPNLPILIFPEIKDGEQQPTNTGDSTEGTNSQQGQQVHSLEEIIPKILEWRQTQQQREEHTSTDGPLSLDDSSQMRPKVVLLVLDATWKFAKEMHRKNQGYYPPHVPRYPPHTLRMALQPSDLPDQFQPSRFAMRTTPRPEGDTVTTSAWMCTAECVSWILSQIEQPSQPENSIYETVIRAIDAAVETHNSFIQENKKNPRDRKKNNDSDKNQASKN